MTNDDLKKFRGVFKEEINTALKPIGNKIGTFEEKISTFGNKIGTFEEKISTVEKKLDTLWDQVVEVTENLSDVKETLKSHTASFKRIEEKNEYSADNTVKLDKRIISIENQLGISPPPELTITR